MHSLRWSRSGGWHSFHGRQTSYLSPSNLILRTNLSYTKVSSLTMPSDSRFQNHLRQSSRVGSAAGYTSILRVCVEANVRFTVTSRWLAGPDRIHPTFVWMAVGPPSPLMTCHVAKSQYESDSINMSISRTSETSAESANSRPSKWSYVSLE